MKILILSILLIPITSGAYECGRNVEWINTEQGRADAAQAEINRLNGLITTQSNQFPDWKKEADRNGRSAALARRTLKVLAQGRALFAGIKPALVEFTKVSSQIQQLNNLAADHVQSDPAREHLLSSALTEAVDQVQSRLSNPETQNLRHLVNLLRDYETSSVEWTVEQSRVQSQISTGNVAVLQNIIEGLIRFEQQSREVEAELSLEAANQEARNLQLTTQITEFSRSHEQYRAQIAGQNQVLAQASAAHAHHQSQAARCTREMIVEAPRSSRSAEY